MMSLVGVLDVLDLDLRHSRVVFFVVVNIESVDFLARVVRVCRGTRKLLTERARLRGLLGGKSYRTSTDGRWSSTKWTNPFFCR